MPGVPRAPWGQRRCGSARRQGFPSGVSRRLSGSPERHGKGEGPGGCETVVEEPYLRFEQLAFRPVELRDAGAGAERPAGAAHLVERRLGDGGVGHQRIVGGRGPRLVETPVERHRTIGFLAAGFLENGFVSFALHERAALDQLVECLCPSEIPLYRRLPEPCRGAAIPGAEGMVLLPGRPGAGREELLGRNDLFEDFARRNARDAELGVGRKVAVVNQLENIAALPVKR